ncbi:hypothetical protein SAMN05421812_106301 [Asanoa hainanensis]|uniref:Uncharacterized protein n=1 Tax=Asanoa hainanensis TaxID=560556 RepID=A0A239MUS3_9ACTN|nr:hypothetical protein [Asanoa hainanensis]SNT45874.1 hypothetical protein SAMN05421812_106301 [Asanoa hainanensis]
MIGTKEFDTFVNDRDRAVWSSLHVLSGTLEVNIPEIFAPHYTARLEAARERLLDTLGDLGRPPADEEAEPERLWL